MVVCIVKYGIINVFKGENCYENRKNRNWEIISYC